MSTWRVVIDRQRCTGAGICVAIAPASFEMGADQISTATARPGDSLEAVLQAADECPTQAIQVLRGTDDSEKT